MSTTCAQCCETFSGRVRVYCSPRCRNRAKYLRALVNGVEASKRVKRKARYVPHPMVRVGRLCSIDGCERKHLALGMCRPHWKQARWAAGIDGRGTACPRVEVGAVVWRHSALAPVGQRLICRLTVGAMVPCPLCAPIFMRAFTPTFRLCESCGTSLELNPDDLAAVMATRS